MPNPNHLIELAEQADLRKAQANSMALTLARRRPLSAGPAGADHVRNNRKLETLREERCAQIEHENLLLLSRMHTIVRAGPSSEHWRDPRTASKGSLHARVRRAEHERIDRENRMLLSRIQRVKPQFSSKAMAETGRAQERMVMQISAFASGRKGEAAAASFVPIRPASASGRRSGSAATGGLKAAGDTPLGAAAVSNVEFDSTAPAGGMLRGTAITAASPYGLPPRPPSASGAASSSFSRRPASAQSSGASRLHSHIAQGQLLQQQLEQQQLFQRQTRALANGLTPYPSNWGWPAAPHLSAAPSQFSDSLPSPHTGAPGGQFAYFAAAHAQALAAAQAASPAAAYLAAAAAASAAAAQLRAGGGAAAPVTGYFAYGGQLQQPTSSGSSAVLPSRYVSPAQQRNDDERAAVAAAEAAASRVAAAKREAAAAEEAAAAAAAAAAAVAEEAAHRASSASPVIEASISVASPATTRGDSAAASPIASPRAAPSPRAPVFHSTRSPAALSSSPSSRQVASFSSFVPDTPRSPPETPKSPNSSRPSSISSSRRVASPSPASPSAFPSGSTRAASRSASPNASTRSPVASTSLRSPTAAASSPLARSASHRSSESAVASPLGASATAKGEAFALSAAEAATASPLSLASSAAVALAPASMGARAGPGVARVARPESAKAGKRPASARTAARFDAVAEPQVGGGGAGEAAAELSAGTEGGGRGGGGARVGGLSSSRPSSARHVQFSASPPVSPALSPLPSVGGAAALDVSDSSGVLSSPGPAPGFDLGATSPGPGGAGGGLDASFGEREEEDLF